MKTSTEILLAGFGGQGILFAGKVLAEVGLIQDRHVSWLPSYGPEMRGGTAHCSVILSDEPIGSPLVTAPDVLIALNQPSFAEFAPTVKPDGTILADTTLINDQSAYRVGTLITLEATKIAEQAELVGLANIVMVGRLAAALSIAEKSLYFEAIDRCVPPSKAALIEKNHAAFELGFSAAS